MTSKFMAFCLCITAVVCSELPATHTVAQENGGIPRRAERIPVPAATPEVFQATVSTRPANSAPRETCYCAGEVGIESVDRIKQALAQPVHSPGLDFVKVPLQKVVSELRSEYQIPIELDVLSIEDAGLTADEPVSIQIDRVTLKTALERMLRRIHLTYFIDGEVLLIATPERAEEDLTTCVYDVRDLVSDGVSFQALADAITVNVAQDTWAKYDRGMAEIRPVRPGLLVISHTRHCHDEIQDLLTAIRASKDGERLSSPPAGVEYGTGGEFGDVPGMGGEFSPVPEEADEVEVGAGTEP